MVTSKRRRDDDDDAIDATPRKMRATVGDAAETPRSILKKSGLANGVNGTPTSRRKLLFATPTKAAPDDSPNGTPTIVRHADRSARRKSNRRILERTLNGAESDEDAQDEDVALAEHILGDEEEEENAVEPKDGVDDTSHEQPIPPETPVKRGRGRPKGSGKVGRPRKQPLPSPPTELPPHEEYFWQNRPGGAKTSNNTLSAQTLLNHDEYFQTMQAYEDRHAPEMAFLVELHGRAYEQWIFELDQGFNICLYGYGSKRVITGSFTQRLYTHLMERAPYKGTKKTPKIVVVNGYAPGITIKDVLASIASACIPSTAKLPNQPTLLLDFILEHLTTAPPPHPVPVILNSIDSVHLRRGATPSLLARLAAHPHINLVCTADTPHFPLLWDVSLRTQYKFLFHDATTFAPYDAEIDVVETVNELLGRSGRRIGGKDGIGFVLRSLPKNARDLYRILVTEQLTLALADGGDYDIDQDEFDQPVTPRNSKVERSKPTKADANSNSGVEYRALYQKAVEVEMVCTSEMAFRTLLKEFHDHQMVESGMDAAGTERLWVPFRRDELEALVEELSAEA